MSKTLSSSSVLFVALVIVGGAGAACSTKPDVPQPDDNGLGAAPGSGGGAGNAAGGGIIGATGGGSPGNGGYASGGGDASGGRPSLGDYGFYPFTVDDADARAAYEAWKTIHLEDCGGGVQRVRWENARLDATVSEGIGYGMLLAVIWDDRAAFDGMFEYGKLMRRPIEIPGANDQPYDDGLMNWLRYGCDAHRETKYNGYPDFAAADADLDVAMALIMAECRWGEARYSDEATVVINGIRERMFMESNGLLILQPGNSPWYDQMGGGCVNYSYFAPAYYRVFAEQVPADADFWNKAARDNYQLLNAASHPVTGLVRNWGSDTGGDATSACHDAYNRAASYGDDAARTPWRMATDYLWFGVPEAKQWTDKVTAWVKTQGIQSTIQWYHLDGSPDTEASTYDDHTVINVGPWATGAMTLDQATVDEFAAEVVAIPAGPTDHDGEYFARMLKALSLASLTGNFTQCGGKR